MGAAIARSYGVTPKAVRDIWNRRTWSDVTSVCLSKSDSDASTNNAPLAVHKRAKTCEQTTTEFAHYLHSNQDPKLPLSSPSGTSRVGINGAIGPLRLQLDALAQPDPPRTVWTPEYRNIGPILSMYTDSAEVNPP